VLLQKAFGLFRLIPLKPAQSSQREAEQTTSQAQKSGKCLENSKI
jgi:hypothetical protein